jgi:hypothetical protein
MDFAKHKQLFSAARLNRYLAAVSNDPAKAVDLYKYNIQIAQTLQPLISILEVALRNGIDRALNQHFHDPEWLITQRSRFARHPNLTYRNARGQVMPDYFFLKKLGKADKKLADRGIRLTHGKLMAELTFGFWVKFFNSNSIKILRGAPLQAFQHKPKCKLANVHSHLNAIVTLRNRIAHNEPICFNNKGHLCLKTLESHEKNIMDALGWIDRDLHTWCEKMNFFRPVYNRIRSGL